MNAYGALGLHEEPLAEPSGPQVKVDIHRDGTLAWMLREMVDKIIGYEQDITWVRYDNPAAVMFVVDWQARRSVLVGWLERLTTLVERDFDGD